MAHRVGIIGLGTVGSRFVEQFAAHPDFDLVAAWDPDPTACAAHRSAVHIGVDAAEVISAADVVYVAVPPLFHRHYVEAGVAAGTAIFCEKPLGIDLAESRELVDLVAASGLPAGVNFVFGAAPAATRLQSATTPDEQGTTEVGEIVRGELRLHFAEWPRTWHAKAQWLRRRDQGGWIREVASHFVFLALRTLGPVRLETSAVTFPDGPAGELCEVDAIARFRAGDHPLLMIGTSGGAGPDVVDFTIRGTTGSRRIRDWYRLQTADPDGWSDVLGSDRTALAAAAYSAQLDALSALLDGGPTPLATFPEALAVQEVVEAVLSAHDAGDSRAQD